MITKRTKYYDGNRLNRYCSPEPKMHQKKSLSSQRPPSSRLLDRAINILFRIPYIVYTRVYIYIYIFLYMIERSIIFGFMILYSRKWSLDRTAFLGQIDSTGI